MKLSIIKSSLDELGITPSKSMGQNFLHDQNLAAWMVTQLDLQPADHLVEIGPGLGALTKHAVGRCASMTLIEKDGRLAEFLRGRFVGNDVEVVHQDAVEFDVRKLMPKGTLKVLGNLPYYASSQILFKFTAEPLPVSCLVFTLQKELAERLSAKPGTKDYGSLTLIIQRRWRVKYLRNLPPSVFLPEPKVDSGVVMLQPRKAEELPECDGEAFNKLVKQGFSQRRKQLRKMLAGSIADWAAAVKSVGISEKARAEELTLHQWIAIVNFVRPVSPAGAQNIHDEFFDVVDSNDMVVRSASRHEVHTNKLMHRAVHVFVFNKKGELFLQRRSRWKDASPLKWDSSAAGHVIAGQDYDSTAERELIEELGVTAAVEFVGKINSHPETGFEFVHLYQTRHDGPFVLARSEIDFGSFFPIDLIRDWMTVRPGDFASGFLECFKLFDRERTN